jgi:hypothetical protein
MNCEQIQQELPAYLKQELTPSELAGIRLHLEHCFSCNAEKQSFEKIFSLFQYLPRLEPSERYYHQLSESFSENSFSQNRKKSRVFLRFLPSHLQERPLWYFSTLAHAALLLFLALLYVRSSPQATPPINLYQVMAELPKADSLPTLPYSAKRRTASVAEEILSFALPPATQNPFHKDFPWIKHRQEKAGQRKASLLPLELHEKIITQGISFLAKTQKESGAFETSPASSEYEIGLSSLALFVFLAEGSSHQEGLYREILRKGILHLLQEQHTEGVYKGLIGTPQGHYLYNHSLATLVLLENYLMSGAYGHKAYENALKDAILYLVEAQGKDGGWGYTFRSSSSNLSVSSWPLQVLHLASQTPLSLDLKNSSLKARFFLQSLRFDSYKIAYSYRENSEHGPVGLQACGFWSAYYLGNVFPEEILEKQIHSLLEEAQIAPEKSKTLGSPLYFWYYGTALLSAYTQQQGELWGRWQTQWLRTLQANLESPENQKIGAIFWDDPYKNTGGSLYTTAFTLLILQVDYRYR